MCCVYVVLFSDVWVYQAVTGALLQFLSAQAALVSLFAPPIVVLEPLKPEARADHISEASLSL